MHFCGLAKARSISVIHNHYSHLCRIAEGLSDHQGLSRLSTAANSGRVLKPSRLLSIGSAAVIAGSSLSKARAATQQTRSPVTRIYATSQDQTVSDSTADSSLSAVDSEPASNGSSNGHLSPQDGPESSGGGSLAPPQQLRLNLAAALMPHPNKAHRGGEDAVFLSDDGLTFGLADGVGSWIESGVDAGIFARELMGNCESAAKQIAPSKTAPMNILKNGFYDTKKMGSSTACILALEGATLHAANLGDSGFMVVRRNKVAFKSRSQQHQFNYPFQLGRGGRFPFDSPAAAECYSVPLKEGDVIIAGTDGVWDNLFDPECAALVSQTQGKGQNPAQSAEALARCAHMRGADPQATTPFSIGCQQLGFQEIGGKLDDIAVIIAYVEGASKM
ncbi:g2206 [Coccomyxa viridis]|uniref:Protein phosphatase n=1 Tax=Coccomyxa viridis TaxID=1274662 RepID=A0ABP1FNR3_9CHLO